MAVTPLVYWTSDKDLHRQSYSYTTGLTWESLSPVRTSPTIHDGDNLKSTR